MAWVRQYSAQNLVGARQEALLRWTEQRVRIASTVKKTNRINNIGTKDKIEGSNWPGSYWNFRHGGNWRGSENSIWKKTTGHTGGQFRVRVR